MATDSTSSQDLPKHIAIIMDGNGRWAKKRLLPRFAGHKAGVKATRRIIEICAAKQISALTLFAFSSENWKRPEKEVNLLMDLFASSLKDEAPSLHANNIRMKIIGDRSAFSEKLQRRIAEVETLTAENSGMCLTVAANYGGRWDIVQAVQKMLKDGVDADTIKEETINQYMSLAELPEPDLFIRTGGEHRISNFLLWQLAYTELHFSDSLWPAFGEAELFTALTDFAGRQRRYGQTPEQVEEKIITGSTTSNA